MEFSGLDRLCQQTSYFLNSIKMEDCFLQSSAKGSFRIFASNIKQV